MNKYQLVWLNLFETIIAEARDRIISFDDEYYSENEDLRAAVTLLNIAISNIDDLSARLNDENDSVCRNLAKRSSNND